MLRPIASYVLVSLILLSQIGLPIHMHYCKGMLESVSIFFSAVCDDHEDISSLPSCCQKANGSTCQKESSCCDDEITVLLQDFDSTLPHFDKWDNSFALVKSISIPDISFDVTNSWETPTSHALDSGPPIYILFSSLIFYA